LTGGVVLVGCILLALGTLAPFEGRATCGQPSIKNPRW
jgi:hypothetical protein